MHCNKGHLDGAYQKLVLYMSSDNLSNTAMRFYVNYSSSNRIERLRLGVYELHIAHPSFKVAFVWVVVAAAGCHHDNC